jgi:hypothetical protein
MSRSERRQSLRSRVFWFVVGGLISTGLNAGPFKLLKINTALPSWAAYGLSLSFVTLLFAFWNYHINFTTQHGWKSCLARYIVAVIICAGINYCVASPLLVRWENLWLPIIAAVQIGMGGIKFLIYHFWVYPRTALGGEEPAIVEA